MIFQRIPFSLYVFAFVGSAVELNSVELLDIFRGASSSFTISVFSPIGCGSCGIVIFLIVIILPISLPGSQI